MGSNLVEAMLRSLPDAVSVALVDKDGAAISAVPSFLAVIRQNEDSNPLEPLDVGLTISVADNKGGALKIGAYIKIGTGIKLYKITKAAGYSDYSRNRFHRFEVKEA